VFDAILQRAHKFCAAPCGTLQLYDGETFRAVATRDYPEAWAEPLRQGYRAADRPVIQPLLDGVRFLQIPDWAEVDDRWSAQAEGIHTALFVPLRRENALLGMITAARHEIRPFTDKQVALLESFAVQAVIAMDNARLLGEIRQRQAELRVTFDNMGDGVAMFDADLQLAAWNRNFQELLQLSDDYLAVPHGFDDYIRFLTARGEFGETDPEIQIKRLRARLGEHYSFDRTRPDGTVIEVRNNPMPDGGVVVIYSDITERKRSEEEIRAARDAAEAALRDLRTAQSSLIDRKSVV
jgi:two-component system NtrC family sensor kinase